MIAIEQFINPLDIAFAPSSVVNFDLIHHPITSWDPIAIKDK